jgi:hypothetical protein
MSEHEMNKIWLTRDQEEILALVPPENRLDVAKKIGVTPPPEQPEETPETTRGTPQPRTLIVAGLALVLAAALVLAGVYIPEVVHSGTARVACALGLVGLTGVFFGLMGLYLSRD